MVKSKTLNGLRKSLVQGVLCVEVSSNFDRQEHFSIKPTVWIQPWTSFQSPRKFPYKEARETGLQLSTLILAPFISVQRNSTKLFKTNKQKNKQLHSRTSNLNQIFNELLNKVHRSDASELLQHFKILGRISSGLRLLQACYLNRRFLTSMHLIPVRNSLSFQLSGSQEDQSIFPM